MAIAFFGTPHFAVPALEALAAAGEVIALVATQHDKRRSRGGHPEPSPVKHAALAMGVKVMEPLSMRDEAFLAELRGVELKFIVVVAYGRILTPDVLAIPKIACVNLHASLLPQYRGAAPISKAILDGHDHTGLTTMLMAQGLDTGDMLMQESHPIHPDDTTQTLTERLAMAGAPLLVKTLQGLREGTIKPQPQPAGATYAPTLKKTDGEVDWQMPARLLDSFVRGMQPWPGAYTTLDGIRVKLTKAIALDGIGTPGEVMEADGGLVIGTGQGLLRVTQLQPQGKRPMAAGDFLRGHKVSKGTVAQ